MLSKDIAICIRSVNYSETSQIVTFFTRANGKISAIAKGSKRPKSPFDGPIEILSYGRIVFSDPSREKLAVLTEFEQEQGFESLARDSYVLNCSLFAAELVSLLTDKYDPHPLLFDGFLHFLKNSSRVKKSQNVPRGILSLLIIFQLGLLKDVGLQLILKNCVNCKRNFTQNWPQVYFSSSANGFICKDCEGGFPDKIRLTSVAAQCLSNFTPTTQADRKTLNEIEKVLIYHFTELLHKPPRMAKYVL